MRAGLPTLCEDNVSLGLSFIGFASARRVPHPRMMFASLGAARHRWIPAHKTGSRSRVWNPVFFCCGSYA
jgi:hypothetical protein